MANDDGGGLSQRELILEIRDNLRALTSKIDEKADRRAVHAVESRIDGVDIRLIATTERVTLAEAAIKQAEAVAKGKAALLSVLIALIVCIVAVGGLLLKIAGGS